MFQTSVIQPPVLIQMEEAGGLLGAAEICSEKKVALNMGAGRNYHLTKQPEILTSDSRWKSEPEYGTQKVRGHSQDVHSKHCLIVNFLCFSPKDKRCLLSLLHNKIERIYFSLLVTSAMLPLRECSSSFQISRVITNVLSLTGLHTHLLLLLRTS